MIVKTDIIKDAIIRHRDKIAVLFILALSLVPRILLLSKGPFHFDVVEYLISMRDKTATFHTASFPLVALVVVAFGYLRDALIPGVPPVKVILTVTALIAALAPVALYIPFKKLFGRRQAFIYALLVSFITPFFSVTTFGRLDSALALLFLPLAIYYLFENKRVLCALFTSLCIASRPEAVIILAIYPVFLIFNDLTNKSSSLSKGRRLLVSLKDFGFMLLLSLLPVMIIALCAPGGRQFFGVFLKGISPANDPSYWKSVESFEGIKWDRILGGFKELFVMAMIPLPLFMLGLIKKLFERDFKALFFFLASFLVFFVLLVNMQTLSPRYLIFPAFFMLFFSSAAAVFIFSRWRIFGILTVSLAVIFMYMPVFHIALTRHLNAYQPDFVKYVESITEQNSLIITEDEQVFFRYYTKRDVITPPINADKDEWLLFFKQVGGAVRGGRPLYLTTTAFSYDRFLIFMGFIQRNFRLKQVGVRLNENWHSMETSQHLFKEQLFRLLPISLVKE